MPAIHSGVSESLSRETAGYKIGTGAAVFFGKGKP